MSYFEEQKDIPDDIERDEQDRGKGKQPRGSGDTPEPDHEGEGECDCGALDGQGMNDGDIDDDGREYDESGHAEDCPANPANSGEGEGDGEGDGSGGSPEPFTVIDLFDARRMAGLVWRHREKVETSFADWPTLKGAKCQLHPGEKTGAIHTGCGVLLAIKGDITGKVSIIQSDCHNAPKLPGWKPEWVLDAPGESWEKEPPHEPKAFNHRGDKFRVTCVLDAKPLYDWILSHAEEGKEPWRPTMPKFVLYTHGLVLDPHGHTQVAERFLPRVDKGGYVVNAGDNLLISVRVDSEDKQRLVLVRRDWFKKNYPEWQVSE